VKPRVLFVDDEPRVLDGIQDTLRRICRVSCATSGQQALELIAAEPPFEVIVSDMRMPHMNGAQLLARVREEAPTSVRMLLTGHADVDAAIAAINEGAIFRFLTKPCPPQVLASAIGDAVRQHRLIVAEKELLERTLKGSIAALMEVLALVNPLAFSRTTRLREYVVHMARELDRPDAWQLELAAMLSQVGCVTLPEMLIEKVRAGQPLDDDERRLFESHPSVGKKLLSAIPRLEHVAAMIDGQLAPADASDEVSLGSRMIAVALDFDRLAARGLTPPQVVGALRQNGRHEKALLDALLSLPQQDGERVLKTVRVRGLQVGMTFDEGVYSTSGILLAAAGQEVTFAVLRRLQALVRSDNVREPFRVAV